MAPSPRVGADPFLEEVFSRDRGISTVLDRQQKPIFLPSEDFPLVAAVMKAVLESHEAH